MSDVPEYSQELNRAKRDLAHLESLKLQRPLRGKEIGSYADLRHRVDILERREERRQNIQRLRAQTPSAPQSNEERRQKEVAYFEAIQQQRRLRGKEIPAYLDAKMRLYWNAERQEKKEDIASSKGVANPNWRVSSNWDPSRTVNDKPQPKFYQRFDERASLNPIDAAKERLRAAEETLRKADPGSHAHRWALRAKEESQQLLSNPGQVAKITPALPPARSLTVPPSAQDFFLTQQKLQKAQDEQEKKAAEQRLGAYRFAAQVQAYERLSTGAGDLALAEVARYPEHAAAIKSGQLSLPHLLKLAALENKPGDLFAKRVQAAHILRMAQRPENMPSGVPIPPVHLPPSIAEWQKKNQAAESLRQQTIEKVAQGLLDHQWVASTQEAMAIATSHYGHLTHEQLLAVSSDSAQRFIHAGPGTGKTKTAAAGLLYQIAIGAIDPRTLVLASPTHSGKQALMNAIGEHGDLFPESWKETPEKFENLGRTVHSLAYRALHAEDENHETAMQKLGYGGWKILGAGNRLIDSAKTVEEAVMMSGQDREAYLRQLLAGKKAKPESFGAASSYISKMKQDQGAKDLYQEALDKGEQDWKMGNASNQAMLYLYENSLKSNQTIDLDDLIHLWSLAGQANGGQGFTPKIRAGVFGESQSFSKDMIRALLSNSTKGSRLIFEGDIGQQTTGGAEHVDELLARGFGQTGSYREFPLVANQRMPMRAAELAAAIYTDPSVRLHGASPVQISANGREGLPETYALGSSFRETHNKAIDQLFGLMQLTPEQMQANVQSGYSPFRGAAIAARDMPVIFQIVHGAGNERTKFNRSIFQRFEQMWGRNFASHAMQLGVTQQTPGSEKSFADQLHLLSVQQAQSQGFPHPFVSATRGGQWDDAGFLMNLGVGVSRATEQAHIFATSANFPNTPGFDNTFEQHPGYPEQLVPHGFASLIERAAYYRHALHGDSLESLPEGLRIFDLPLEQESPYLDQGQMEALQSFIGDWLGLMKAVPPVVRQVDLSEARGVIQAQPGDFIEYNDENGEERADYTGFSMAGGGTTAVANFDMKNLPDEALFANLEDYAAQLMENPALEAPEDLAKFIKEAKANTGRIKYGNMQPHPGELTSQELMTLGEQPSTSFKQDEPERVLDNLEQNEYEKELFGGLSPEVYAHEDFLVGGGWKSSRLVKMLTDPQILADYPGLVQSLSRSVNESDAVLRLFPGGAKADILKEQPELAKIFDSTDKEKFFQPTFEKMFGGADEKTFFSAEQLGHIGMVARSLAMHHPLSPHDRREYTEMAKVLEGLSGSVPEKDEQVTLPMQSLTSMLYGPMRYDPLPHPKGEANPREALGILQMMASGGTDTLHFKPTYERDIENLRQKTMGDLSTINDAERARHYQIGIGEIGDTHFAKELLSLSQHQFLDPQDVIYNKKSGTGILRGGQTHLNTYRQRLEELVGRGGFLNDERRRRIDPKDLAEAGDLGNDLRKQMNTEYQAANRMHNAFTDDRKLLQYGHYLNQVHQIATGQSPFANEGKNQSLLFDAFNERSKAGGVSFDDLYELYDALESGSADVRKRGIMNRGNVDRTLQALGLDPQDPAFLGLLKLGQLGFDTADKELPLVDMAGNPNLLDLMAAPEKRYKDPEIQERMRSRRAQLATLFTRAPALFGEQYTIKQGPFDAPLNEIQQRMGLRAGLTGTLQAWPTPRTEKEIYGGAALKWQYLASKFNGQEFDKHRGGLRLFTRKGESAYTKEHYPENSPLPPVYVLKTADGRLFPVRQDQIDLARYATQEKEVPPPEQYVPAGRTRISKARAHEKALAVIAEIKERAQDRLRRFAKIAGKARAASQYERAPQQERHVTPWERLSPEVREQLAKSSWEQTQRGMERAANRGSAPQPVAEHPQRLSQEWRERLAHVREIFRKGGGTPPPPPDETIRQAHAMAASEHPAARRVSGPFFKKVAGPQKGSVLPPTGFADLDQFLGSIDFSSIGIRGARDAAKAFVGQKFFRQDIIARDEALRTLKENVFQDPTEAKSRRALENIYTVFGQATGLAHRQDSNQSGVLAPSLHNAAPTPPVKAAPMRPKGETPPARPQKIVAQPARGFAPLDPNKRPQKIMARPARENLVEYGPPVPKGFVPPSQDQIGRVAVSAPPSSEQEREWAEQIAGMREGEQNPFMHLPSTGSARFDAFLMGAMSNERTMAASGRAMEGWIQEKQFPQDEGMQMLHSLDALAEQLRGNGPLSEHDSQALQAIDLMRNQLAKVYRPLPIPQTSQDPGEDPRISELTSSARPHSIQFTYERAQRRKAREEAERAELQTQQKEAPTAVRNHPMRALGKALLGAGKVAGSIVAAPFVLGAMGMASWRKGAKQDLPLPEEGYHLRLTGDQSFDAYYQGFPFIGSHPEHTHDVATRFAENHLQSREDADRVDKYFRDELQYVRDLKPESISEDQRDSALLALNEARNTNKQVALAKFPPPRMQAQREMPEIVRASTPPLSVAHVVYNDEDMDDPSEMKIGRVAVSAPPSPEQEREWAEQIAGLQPEKTPSPSSGSQVSSQEDWSPRWKNPPAYMLAPEQRPSGEQFLFPSTGHAKLDEFLAGLPLNRPPMNDYSLHGYDERMSERAQWATYNEKQIDPFIASNRFPLAERQQIREHLSNLSRGIFHGNIPTRDRGQKVDIGLTLQRMAERVSWGNALLGTPPTPYRQDTQKPEKLKVPLDLTEMHGISESPQEFRENFQSDIAAAIMSGEQGSKLFPKPSEEQRAIYQYQGKRLRIRGGPGTAKTSALLNGLLYRAVSGQGEPNQVQLLSYTHSGVDEMASRVRDINERLAGMGDSTYQIQTPKTIYALAHQIITKGSERKGHYPVMEGFKRPWTGNIIQDLTPKELADLPEEDRAAYISPDDYLRQAILARGYAEPGKKTLKDYLQFIDQAKSERSDDDLNNLYNKGRAQGSLDLNKGIMTKEAALELWENKLFNRGDIDFQDMPHFASLALDEQGAEAVPSQYRRVNLLGIDEGQDNNRVGMRMVGKYVKALAENTPTVVSAFDPNQALIPRAGGGLNPDFLPQEYDQAFGKMDELPLSLNRRSSQGTVYWNNALLSELKEHGHETPPLQKATTSEMGKYPGISLDPHQAAQYARMLSDLMQHAGITIAQAKENYLKGLHPLEGNEQARDKLGRSALVYNQHRDADFSMGLFEQLIAQAEGPALNPAQAKEMREMLFRTETNDSGKKESRALVGTPAKVRSHAYGYLGQDIAHVGGGATKAPDDVSDDWRRSLLIGVSRENEGEVNLYGTNRPFDATQQQQYLADPNVLQYTPGSGYTFDGAYFGQDKRNVPEQFAGRTVPRGLASVMGRVMDAHLAAGGSPTTYLPAYQHPMAENRAAMASVPVQSNGKGTRFHLGSGASIQVQAQAGSNVVVQTPGGGGSSNPQSFLDKLSAWIPGAQWGSPGRFYSPPSGFGGDQIPSGGGGGTSGGQTSGQGGGGGGYRSPYNNAQTNFGRTLSRISDEMSYIGQNMQKAADDAIQEGSDYRHAALAIPLAPGSTTDTYGNSVTSLQNTQSAANQITKGPWYVQAGQVGVHVLGDTFSKTPNVVSFLGALGSGYNEIAKNGWNIGGYFSDLGTQAQQQNQQALSFWSDIGKNGWNIGQDFQDAWTHVLGGSPSPGQSAPGPKKQSPDHQSPGGPSGTQGFFDFTDVSNPNTIGYLQQNVLPMYSDTQIVQALQQYFGATNTYFSKQGVNAATNDMALAAMSGMDPSQLISQMTGITGYSTAASGVKGTAAYGQAQDYYNNQLAGIVLNMFKGNLSEQNVQPFMDYLSSTVGNIAGENPAASIRGANAMPSPQLQASAVAQMAMNAGYSASDLSTTAGLVNSLVGAGMGPDLRQQYALSQLYGAQNMTASPQLVQFNQQQVGNQMQLAGLQLQQKMQIPQVQMSIASAQISLDQVSFEQAQFSLAQNTAQFNQQQYMNNQLYGPIGADVSKEAYFNFQRSQLAAGYDPTSPNNAVNYQPSQPFGLKNEEFYAGIENQRSMLTLSRSPLLADAQYQQQMKYLNEQENFYVREIDLQNEQRAFDKTWGEKSLDMQAKALDAQAKMLPLQIQMEAYQGQQAAIQAQYLPQQVALQQQLIDNLSQWVKGEGPVKGGNPSVTSIIQQLESSYQNDKGSASQKKQDLQYLIQELDLPADQQAQLYNIIVQAANSHESVAQIMNQLQHYGAGDLIKQLQQGISAGAYGGQQEAAGNTNANLQAGGTGQQWSDLIQTMKDDKDAVNNLKEALSGTTGLTKRIGDLSSALAPVGTGISALNNILGALEGLAAGGAGGAGGGGRGGAMEAPPPAAPMPKLGQGGATPTPEGNPKDKGPAGDPRNALAPFFIDIMEAISNQARKKNHDTSYPHFGIVTPNVNTEFHTPMWYGELHQGVDFAAAQGSQLSEFIGGQVKATGFFPWGGEIDVEIPGGLTERYLHLSQIGVSAGQKIKRGQHIGLTGGGTPQSGLGYWSSGSHLHAQIDEGDINAGIDPWPVWAAFGDRDIIPYIGGVLAQPGLNGFSNSNPGSSSGPQRGKGNQHGDIGGAGGGFLAGMADGGIAMSPIITPLAEKEPETVIPLSKLGQVLAMYQQQNGATPTVTQPAAPSISIQTLVGTMTLSVNTTATTLSDAEKDQLIADAVGVLDTAIQAVMHRI